MANGPTFVKAFVEITGTSFSVLDKLMSTLIAARVLPPSGRGGGSRATHYDHWQASLWVLANAAGGAGSAVATLKELTALEWTDKQAGDFGDLPHFVAAEIAIRARRIYDGRSATGPHEATDLRLVICLDPVSASMQWTENGEPRRRDFAPPDGKQGRRRGIRRLTEIDIDVLNAAAELCADSLRHTAQNNEAATQPRATAPSRNRRTSTTPPRCVERLTQKTGQPQGRGGRAPGNVTRKTRSNDHGRAPLPAPPAC